MYNVVFDCSIAVEVHTKTSIDLVSKKLKLLPTMTIVKGEKRPLVGVATENIWILKQSFLNCEFIDDKIQKFLKEKNITSKKCKWLQRCGNCVIRVYVQSDDAQIGFALNSKDLKLLSRLGIPLEFSVFSWGGAKDFEG